MDNRFRNLLLPKNIQDATKLSELRMIRNILVIVFIASAVGLVLDGIIGKRIFTVITLSIVLVLTAISGALLRMGNDRMARFVVPAAMLLGLSFLIWQGGGMHDVILLALIAVVILASLTLGPRATLAFGIFTSLATTVIGIAEIRGILVNRFSYITDYEDVILVTLIIMSITGLQQLLIGRLNASIAQEKKIAEAEVRSNRELRNLQISLENRVKDRTIELEESSKKAEQRASQLEAISSVASSIASVQDVDQLLPYITKLISERFSFYHVGIFLLDENKEFALLRAANSDGGKKMLARHHKLRIGEEGIVGFSIHEKKARIALDVGEDAEFFDNPDLPATRSELSLPLIIGSDVIGALDVQSEKPAAFTTEDVQVLSTLANQVAVAIQNARLFERSQENVKNLERTFQRYVLNEWRQFTADSSVKGYRAYDAGLEPIGEPLQVDIKNDRKDTIYQVPITLRGATIATLGVDLGKRSEQYTEEEIAIIQAAAERVGLALENARLIQESQRQAAKEQLIGDISTKISASINMRNVLQAAVEELGRVIPGSDIVVQFQEVDEKKA